MATIALKYSKYIQGNKEYVSAKQSKGKVCDPATNIKCF
jgi:hypothetical protein